ncbi:MAG: L-seryl-tRNA(Sec) selenium transferase, partial [Myxococcota bacterium]
LEPRARRLLELVSKQIAEPWRVRIEASEAAVGGGSLPEHRLPGWAVVLEGPRVDQVARRLRDAPTPVLARLRDDALWLDVRTVREDEFQTLASALTFALL